MRKIKIFQNRKTKQMREGLSYLDNVLEKRFDAF